MTISGTRYCLSRWGSTAISRCDGAARWGDRPSEATATTGSAVDTSTSCVRAGPEPMPATGRTDVADKSPVEGTGGKARPAPSVEASPGCVASVAATAIVPSVAAPANTLAHPPVARAGAAPSLPRSATFSGFDGATMVD